MDYELSCHSSTCVGIYRREWASKGGRRGRGCSLRSASGHSTWGRIKNLHKTTKEDAFITCNRTVYIIQCIVHGTRYVCLVCMPRWFVWRIHSEEDHYRQAERGWEVEGRRGGTRVATSCLPRIRSTEKENINNCFYCPRTVVGGVGGGGLPNSLSLPDHPAAMHGLHDSPPHQPNQREGNG